MRKLVTLAALALMCTAAGSAERVVHQKGRVFSVATLRVARGEQIVFLNDDTVPHNIMSATAENAFNLGSQTPGEATPVSFDQVGNVMVICAIHPRMHMTIEVGP